MNQQRFDELTRTLATKKLSRGQVFKGLAAGLLLAGPLGSLVQKAGVAQPVTVGCVSTKCVKSAEHEYASCNRRCGRQTNGTVCLEGCQRSFASQLVNCGCVTVNIDAATGKGIPATCADPCTGQTLSAQANQDATYSKLENYLSSDGFVINGGPKVLVLREDGTLLKSVLGASYSHPSRTGETATLYYVVEAGGNTGAYAEVYKDGTLSYVIVVGEDGQVQQGFPPEEQGATGPASQGATGPASATGTSSSSAVGTRTSLSLGNCSLLCNTGCNLLADTVGCGLAIGAICSPTIITGPGAPVAISICVWSLAPGCAAFTGLACSGACNRGCACDPGTYPCDQVCCGTCQDCLNGRCVEKVCGQCQQCDPKSNACVPKTCPSGQTLNPASCECVCIPNQRCEPPNVFNPASCKCECDPNQSCEPPKVLHPEFCTCGCPDKVCTPPRINYDSINTCECYCPVEDSSPRSTPTQPCGDNDCCVPCAGSLCAPGQVCCGHGLAPQSEPQPGELCCSNVGCCNESAGPTCCPFPEKECQDKTRCVTPAPR